MSKLNAKQQGTAITVGISSGIASDTAKRPCDQEQFER